MKKSIILLVASMAAGSTTLFASMSETFSHVTSPTAVPFSDPFTLPAFDPAMGSLTGIEIMLTNNSVAEVDIYNMTGVAKSFTNAMASVPLKVTGPDGTTTTITTFAGPFSGVAQAGFNALTGITSNASTSIAVASSHFGAYEGASGVNLAFTSEGLDGTFSGTSVSHVAFSGSAVAGGTTSITYTYDSVVTPEPSMVGSLGLGMLGLAFAARKRFAKTR